MKMLPRGEDLREWVEFEKNQIVKFLGDLISIPSPSGQEGKVVERVRMEMEHLGFDEVKVDDMGSVIGR
jgi:putative aminopeptidase FrvX